MASIPLSLRWLTLLLALPVMALPFAALTGRTAQEPVAPPSVHVLSVDGVINPLTARYLKRGLEEAAREGASAVVVQLNTPGGLETSMREMVEELLASTVPVVVYVTPSGAHAACSSVEPENAIAEENEPRKKIMSSVRRMVCPCVSMVGLSMSHWNPGRRRKPPMIRIGG
jgi:hypothetical protein